MSLVNLSTDQAVYENLFAYRILLWTAISFPFLSQTLKMDNQLQTVLDEMFGDLNVGRGFMYIILQRRRGCCKCRYYVSHSKYRQRSRSSWLIR